MKRTKKKTHSLMRTSSAGALGASCPAPSYGRVMVSDVIGTMVQLAFIGAGAGVGYAVTRSPVGAFIGGGAGLIGGAYPSIAAARATVQTTPGCPDPSLGSMFVYWLASGLVKGAAGAAGKQIGPHAAPFVSMATLLVTPLLGQSILKT